MLNNIKITKYYNTKSIIHTMHPLAKLICLILFTVATFLINDIMPLTILLSISIIILMLSNVPWHYYFKQLWLMKILIIFIIIINLIIRVPINNSLYMIFKIILIVIYSSIYIFTTTPKETTYALQTFLSPLKIFKINSNRIAFTISLALRFIPIIFEQGNKILKAQASRGIDFNNSKLKDKFLAIKSMLLPMFILSFKKADEISELMELRLYDANDNHNKSIKYSWDYFSIYMPLLHLFILLALIVKEVI